MNVTDLAIMPYRYLDPLYLEDYHLYTVKNGVLFSVIGTVHRTEDGWNSWAFFDTNDKQEFEDREAPTLIELLRAIAEQLS